VAHFPSLYLSCLRCVTVLLLLSGASSAQKSMRCLSPDAAAASEGKNVCVSAHVYDVGELDGTRFLDVCTPQTADQDCHFFIAIFAADKKDVGDLEALRGTDIQIRGTVRSYQGRMILVLNRRQQLHGGNERFVPNPQLTEEAFAGRKHQPDDPHWPANQRFSHVSSTHGRSEVDTGNGTLATTGK
jgi:hypothetical protein